MSAATVLCTGSPPLPVAPEPFSVPQATVTPSLSRTRKRDSKGSAGGQVGDWALGLRSAAGRGPAPSWQRHVCQRDTVRGVLGPRAVTLSPLCRRSDEKVEHCKADGRADVHVSLVC